MYVLFDFYFTLLYYFFPVGRHPLMRRAMSQENEESNEIASNPLIKGKAINFRTEILK
jgi:hypothetical protein